MGLLLALSGAAAVVAAANAQVRSSKSFLFLFSYCEVGKILVAQGTPQPTATASLACNRRNRVQVFEGARWLDRVSALLVQTDEHTSCYQPTKRVCKTVAPPQHPSALSLHYGPSTDLVALSFG